MMVMSHLPGPLEDTRTDLQQFSLRVKSLFTWSPFEFDFIIRTTMASITVALGWFWFISAILSLWDLLETSLMLKCQFQLVPQKNKTQQTKQPFLLFSIRARKFFPKLRHRENNFHQRKRKNRFTSSLNYLIRRWGNDRNNFENATKPRRMVFSASIDKSWWSTGLDLVLVAVAQLSSSTAQ